MVLSVAGARPPYRRFVSKLGFGSVVICAALTSAPGMPQEGKGSLFTVVRSEGYSHSGTAFMFRGETVLNTAAWKQGLPLVSEFRLPASTYVIETGEAFQAQIEISPFSEVVVDVTLEVAADGSYERVIDITDEPFKEWQARSGLTIQYQDTIELEPSHDDVVIELKPLHPLGVLEEFKETLQVEVLAALEEPIESGKVLYPEATTLRVKDMRPPPTRRPPTPTDEGDVEPE